MRHVSELGVVWREARREDASLLRQALEAEAWLEELLVEYDILIKDWGRADDAGVVGMVGRQLAGAAWYRTVEEAPPALGFVAADTPVLADAWIARELRGQGHGTAMLGQLLDLCRTAGHRQISVATDQDNPALRLYWRLGFVTETAVGSRWRLIKALA